MKKDWDILGLKIYSFSFSMDKGSIENRYLFEKNELVLHFSVSFSINVYIFSFIHDTIYDIVWYNFRIYISRDSTMIFTLEHTLL